MSDTSARRRGTGRRNLLAGALIVCLGAVAVGWSLSRGDGGKPAIPRAASWKEAAARSVSGPPEIVWEKTYGGPKIDAARAIVRLADGGFVIAARTRSSGAGKDDVWLLRLDANGKQLWDKTFGHDGKDWATALTVMRDGGFALAGSMERGHAVAHRGPAVPDRRQGRSPLGENHRRHQARRTDGHPRTAGRRSAGGGVDLLQGRRQV